MVSQGDGQVSSGVVCSWSSPSGHGIMLHLSSCRRAGCLASWMLVEILILVKRQHECCWGHDGCCGRVCRVLIFSLYCPGCWVLTEVVEGRLKDRKPFIDPQDHPLCQEGVGGDNVF